MDLERIVAVLRSIKEVTPSLYVTGGEPTLVPHIGEVLRLARRIGFCPGQGKRVFDNILQASEVAKWYGNTLSINCVLTGGNIADARGVLDFCLQHRIQIAVVPAIQRHMPMIAQGDAEQLRAYRDILGEIIALKVRRPATVVGTRMYLEQIRRLGGFRCRPSVIVTISPEGDIVNPCDEKYRTVPKTLGKANGIEPIELQLRHSLKFASAYETCGGNCLKMCYLGPALFLEKPWPSASDILS